VLLSVTAIATGLAKGHLASLIITVVFVFGLFVALWAFSLMSRQQSGFWATTGKIAGAVTLSAILALFCTVLVYVATGFPVWMDHWFQPGFSVPAPANVSAKPGASLLERRDWTTDGHSRSWIVREDRALADAVSASASAAEIDNATDVSRDPRTEITVTWDRSMPSDTNIEISIKEKNQAGDFPPPLAGIPAQTGTASITGLHSGTLYEIRIVAEQRQRRSNPVFKYVATDADQLARLMQRFGGSAVVGGVLG